MMKSAALASPARLLLAVLLGLTLALSLTVTAGLLAPADAAPSKPSAPSVSHSDAAKPTKTTRSKTVKSTSTKSRTTKSNARTSTIPAPNLALDAQTDLTEYANRVMAAINRERTIAGLAPIAQYDACLGRVSLGWAQRLTASATLYHRDQRSVLRKCRLAWAGENLLRGVGVTPEESVIAWMNSPAHRDILLTERATLAGVAFRVDPTGRLVGVLNLGDL